MKIVSLILCNLLKLLNITQRWVLINKNEGVVMNVYIIELILFFVGILISSYSALNVMAYNPKNHWFNKIWLIPVLFSFGVSAGCIYGTCNVIRSLIG